jgi:hypothetical protein
VHGAACVVGRRSGVVRADAREGSQLYAVARTNKLSGWAFSKRYLGVLERENVMASLAAAKELVQYKFLCLCDMMSCGNSMECSPTCRK